MATKKPVVQVVLNPIFYEKLKYIAEYEGRSISNQGARIIEKFIRDYETNNGNITTGDIHIAGNNNKIDIG